MSLSNGTASSRWVSLPPRIFPKGTFVPELFVREEVVYNLYGCLADVVRIQFTPNMIQNEYPFVTARHLARGFHSPNIFPKGTFVPESFAGEEVVYNVYGCSTRANTGFIDTDLGRRSSLPHNPGSRADSN